MAYGLSNGYVTDNVMWPTKVLWGSTVGYPSDSLASCTVSRQRLAACTSKIRVQRIVWPSSLHSALCISTCRRRCRGVRGGYGAWYDRRSAYAVSHATSPVTVCLCPGPGAPTWRVATTYLATTTDCSVPATRPAAYHSSLSPCRQVIIRWPLNWYDLYTHCAHSSTTGTKR